MRERKSLSKSSVSAIKWSFVKHFDSTENRAQRNQAIFEAFEDGYTQSPILKHLDVTASLISQVVKNLRFNI